jgi:nucleotide-binding universal stress UspA family protein
MSVRRVIVGVKDLTVSGAALDWAAREAAANGRHLVVAHAAAAIYAMVPSHGRPGVPGGDRTLEAALVAVRTRLEQDRVQPVLRSGNAGVALVELAYAEDVLVIGAPPRHGWLHARSTTHYVLGHSPCPVVVVPPASSVAGRRAALASAHLGDNLAGQVVVGVDGSAASRAALSFGFAYAARHRLALATVYVAARPPAATKASGSRVLADQVERLEREYPQVPVRRLTVSGSVVSALVTAGVGAAVLVAGISGTRAATSAARGLIDASGTPVALVRLP